jgi:hypothetical protein
LAINDSPGLRLALALAPFPLSDELRLRVDFALEQPLNWQEFLFWVRRHGIGGMVLANMQALGENNFPGTIFQQLKRGQQRASLHNMRLLHALSRVAGLFSANNLNFCLLKGPVFSRFLYKSFSLRTSFDLDILVSPDDFSRSDALLRENNYSLYEPGFSLSPIKSHIYAYYRHHYGYRAPQNNISIELHWSLAEPYYLDAAITREALARAISSQIPGLDVKILSREDALVYTFLHGAKHRWSSAKLLLDPLALLRCPEEPDWEKVQALIRQAHLERAAAQGLAILRALWEQATPPALQQFERLGAATRFLADFGLEALTWREPENRRDPRWFLYGFLLKPTLAYQLHYLSKALIAPLFRQP